MSIVIGHEELALITRLTGKASLRGLPLQLGEDEATILARLSAAENSLQAKGWLRRDGLTISIEKTVLNAVGFLINAPVVLAIRRTLHNTPASSHLFYLSPELRLQVAVETGFYRIDAYESEQFDAALYAVLGQTPHATVKRYPLQNMPRQAFLGLTAAAQLADLTLDDILTQLSTQNMYFEEAPTLLDIYHHTWQATVNLSAWLGDGGEDGAPSSAVTLLDTTVGWWQLEQPTHDTVDLSPLTDEQVGGLLDTLLNRVFAAPL